MGSIAKAIRNEALAKGIQIQDDRTRKVYDILEKLFLYPPVDDKEVAFEKQLFTRGTGGERVGLHTSAIIAGENSYCVREQVLSLLYKPRNMDHHIGLPLLRVFEEGNYIHRKWQRLFLRGGLCDVEDLDKTQYNKKYRLAFSPDAIIELFGQKFVVEIKSMRAEAYRRANRHQSGEKQCRMYMFLAGIKYGIILMENKNDQQFKINVIKHDPNEIAEYIDRLETIKSYYEAKTMPPRQKACKTKLSKRCQDCTYMEPCWASKEERKLLLLSNKGGAKSAKED